MAEFRLAYEKTMGHEGGYVNDHDDRGAETYCGISRRWHPTWPGWALIDAQKEVPGFPDYLKDDLDLPDLVADFYRAEFWDRVNGDHINSQVLASELFDTAVNMDPIDAGKFLQRALNVLNRNGSLYPDMVVDGLIGPTTLGAIEKLANKDVDLLYKMLNVLQGMHYIEYMEEDPTQEKYCRGWFKRVNIQKLSAETIKMMEG